MQLIDRYLFRQLLGPTAVAALALTAVAILTESLSALDILVDQRQSLRVFLKVILLATPQLIAMILPVAVLLGSLVALNRLHTEQEIVICFTGGMSRWRIAAPALQVAGVAALICLVLTLWIQPLCYRALRQTLQEVRTNLAATLVNPGKFSHPAPGVTVYAQSIDDPSRTCSSTTRPGAGGIIPSRRARAGSRFAAACPCSSCTRARPRSSPSRGP